MIIGVTHTLGSEHKFNKYLDWLQCGGETVKSLPLSYTSDNLGSIELCDGLVLTGGHDVDPLLYHRSELQETITNIDSNRDTFEFNVLERALKQEIPVLGICRGLQLANVFFGGTLIPDLEEAGYRSHRSKLDTMECSHAINIVEEDSMLMRISKVHSGDVNSSHHQAVNTLGKGLRVIARSDDGIAEAIEMENNQKQFFLLVQWHPERVIEKDHPFAKNILQAFFRST